MPERRFLLVRLSSLGDIIHALPAAAALRDTFADSRIDWLADQKWARVLEGNRDITEIIALEHKTAGGIGKMVRRLRAAHYDCAVDFQALYKSAMLPFLARVPQRIGFKSSYAREGLAARLYTDRLNPRGAHKVDHNVTLVEAAGARPAAPRFPLAIHEADEDTVSRELKAHQLTEFFVLNPGGGWRSKCWPAERYGELYRRLCERGGRRGVITFGPGEENLAREVIEHAGRFPPAAIALSLGPLMALFRRAQFVVSADTGPLHIASALNARVVGLFGPTDPARNGPFSRADVSVRNPRDCETTYKRRKDFAPSMLSITVDQVLAAIDLRLAR